jgi:hypothetical protein
MLFNDLQIGDAFSVLHTNNDVGIKVSKTQAFMLTGSDKMEKVGLVDYLDVIKRGRVAVSEDGMIYTY